LRAIEREVEKEENTDQKKVLKSLTDIPRVWTRTKLSHPYKLIGLKFFHDLQEEVDIIATMRETRDHVVLQKLEDLLTKSIEPQAESAEDIKKAESWINEVTDILLGERESNENEGSKEERDTEEYIKKMTGVQVREKLHKYVTKLLEDKERRPHKYTPFLKDIILHLYKTYIGWEKYLFACYDHPGLPYTNNALELAHSMLKRLHRRITGKKKSNQFIVLHGETASFCVDIDSYSQEEIEEMIRSVDFSKVQERQKEEKAKSQNRGQHLLIKRDLPAYLQQVQQAWFSCDS